MVSRNNRYDNYKTFLGLLAIYGHTFHVINSEFPVMGGVYVFIYLFHMPAFLFVSGMFSKKVVDNHDIRRCGSLFITYLLVKFIRLISRMIINGKVQYTYLFTEGGIAWFALTTMECLLLTMLVKKVKRSYVFILSILLGCLVGYCKDIGIFLSLSRTFVYFPYFYLGYCCTLEQVEKASNKKWIKIICVVFIVIVFFAMISNAKLVSPYSEFIKSKESYYEYADQLVYPALGGCYRLVLYVIGFALVFAFLLLMPKKKIPIITELGTRTLSMYVFQYPLVKLTYKNSWMKNFALVHCNSAIQIAIFYLIVSIIIYLICSLLPLEKAARKLTSIPMETKNETN